MIRLWKPYAYTGGDPVECTDPTGLYEPPEGGGSPPGHHHKPKPKKNPNPGGGRKSSNYCTWGNGCQELNAIIPTILGLICDILSGGVLALICGGRMDGVVAAALYLIYSPKRSFFKMLLVFAENAVAGTILSFISAPLIRGIGSVFGRGVVKIAKYTESEALEKAGKFILKKFSLAVGKHVKRDLVGWIYRLFGV